MRNFLFACSFSLQYDSLLLSLCFFPSTGIFHQCGGGICGGFVRSNEYDNCETFQLLRVINFSCSFKFTQKPHIQPLGTPNLSSSPTYSKTVWICPISPGKKSRKLLASNWKLFPQQKLSVFAVFETVENFSHTWNARSYGKLLPKLFSNRRGMRQKKNSNSC